MANKTIQALKISATLILNGGARTASHDALFMDSKAEGIGIAGAKLKLNHAIVARFDDPAHSARVTDRIAEIKAALAAKGELDDWRVTAGAVPVGDAEVLPDEPADEAAE